MYPFIWINLNSLHPRILCVKFGYDLVFGSGDDKIYKVMTTGTLTIDSGQ